MATKPKLVAIDAGHGGINRFGQYTTSPNKQHFHGDEYEFHNGGWFYEGVSNRRICKALMTLLDKEKIPYIQVYHPSLDTPLVRRVAHANSAKVDLYISNHSNAARLPNTSEGFEVFTSPGNTRSDEAAILLFDEMNNLFGDEIKYRTDMRDGDADKEENFYVLRATRMPSVLVENLFFDNIKEALLLHRKNVVDRIAEAQLKMIKRFLYGQ